MIIHMTNHFQESCSIIPDHFAGQQVGWDHGTTLLNREALTERWSYLEGNTPMLPLNLLPIAISLDGSMHDVSIVLHMHSTIL